MLNLDKIKMEPIVVYKKKNGKIGIINGHKRIKILRIIGCTELSPEMYNYSDSSYNKEILKISEVEDDLIT